MDQARGIVQVFSSNVEVVCEWASAYGTIMLCDHVVDCNQGYQQALQVQINVEKIA